ncbi:MAG: hypothetical protein H6679_05330 [Epsilonproteobacteria bacterium]|nr:hypothetical protein [Campylobacterota bacterium]
MIGKYKVMCKTSVRKMKKGCMNFKKSPYFHLYAIIVCVIAILMVFAFAFTRWSSNADRRPAIRSGIANESPFRQASNDDSMSQIKQSMMGIAQRIESYASQTASNVNDLREHVKNTDKKLAMLENKVQSGSEGSASDLDQHIEKEVNRQIAVYREKVRRARAAKRR